MRTFAANDNNDLYLDVPARIAIREGLEALGQCCKTAVQAQQGEMIYAMDDGVPMAATAWDSYNPAQFEAACRQVILTIPGVVAVTSFNVTRSDNALNYAATISTIYGAAAING